MTYSQLGFKAHYAIENPTNRQLIAELQKPGEAYVNALGTEDTMWVQAVKSALIDKLSQMPPDAPALFTDVDRIADGRLYIG